MTDATKANALLNLIIETLKLAPKLQLQGDQLTKDLDLTSSRWGVLGIVSQAEKQLTVSDLSRRMNLKPQTVQRFVTAMEQKGFIRLDNNPDHKRAKLIQLTEKGKKVLLILKKRELRWAATITDNMTTQDIEKTRKVLAQLRENITQ